MADHRPSSDSPSPGDAQHEQLTPLQGSFEDEVTSVVNTDIHRATTQEDLNDRVVDQTTLELDDEPDYHDEDDRFGLLARGGRDSVSQARNRMRLRRSGGQPGSFDSDLDDATPPHIDTASETTFLPEDYVEDEAPASDVDEATNTPVQPDDDVMLSEGVAEGGTPRSRRLRRSRETSPDPKSGAVVGTTTNVTTPAIESTEGSAPGRDRFDSIPEIRSTIDLSRLRQPEQQGPGEPIAPARTEASAKVDVPVEDRFERALRKAQEAQAIKAAARAEREGRQTSDRRARATATPPLAQGHVQPAPVPRNLPDTSHYDASVNNNDDLAYLEDDVAPRYADRKRIPTRDQYVEDIPDFDEVEPEYRAYPEPDRRENASRSFWRGLLKRRDPESAAVYAEETAWDDDEQLETFEYQAASLSDQDVWDEPEDEWEDEDHFNDRTHLRPWLENESPIASNADSHLFWDEAEENDVDLVAMDHHAHQETHYEPLDLQHEQGLSAFRDRLFVRADNDRTSSVDVAQVERTPRRSPISLARKRSITHDEPMRPPDYPEREAAPVSFSRSTMHQTTSRATSFRDESHSPYNPARTHVASEGLLDDPADAWYEPEHDDGFDVRNLITQPVELLDMTIDIAPDVPRNCATCRSYRQSEKGGRGWCTNNWAFTHRQMVNATDLACSSTIGCWWLPADEEVWLTDDEPERGATPRVDRLIAHLDPLRRAVGR